jgi:hypothetical protein
MRAKHTIGDFEGFFEWAKIFFYPKIVLSAVEREEHNFNILYVFSHRLVSSVFLHILHLVTLGYIMYYYKKIRHHISSHERILKRKKKIPKV